MESQVALLPVTMLYIIVVTLLLWFIIGSKGRTGLKILVTPLALYFCGAIYVTLPTILGWPTNNSLPTQYEVVYASVTQPVPAMGREGRLYIWIVSKNHELGFFDLYRPNLSDPRAYRLPYTEKKRKELQRAIMMIKAGQPVVGGRAKKKKGGIKIGSPSDGAGNPGDLDQPEDDSLNLYLMPPVELEPK